MDTVSVRELEPAERERAIAIQVMAFGSDPVMRWMYPEPNAYLTHFPRFAEAFGGGAFQHGTADEGGDFGGAAFWLPVGAEVDPGPLEQIFQTTLEPARRDVALQVVEQMGRHHIEEPHWYLAMIGVDPASQGRGIGSALLRQRLRTCDEQRLPAYLESSNPANLSLYQRHGFQVVGEIQVATAPVVYPMLREPRG